MLALIQQKNRVRLLINDKTYVFASPQDWAITIHTLESTIFETVARLGKRQQQVLDRCKTTIHIVNKHYIAKELNVSTHTAARALKVLAQNGYLKEFKNKRPFHYELLREKPNQLSLLENINEFEAVWLKSCRKVLKTICATGQRLGNVKITVEGDLEKQGVSNGCTVAQMPLTRKAPSSDRNEQETLRFPESHKETGLKSGTAEKGE